MISVVGGVPGLGVALGGRPRAGAGAVRNGLELDNVPPRCPTLGDVLTLPAL